MLKKLHIQNFQSHKDTTIDFQQGLNVVIGQSDGGKSSIIRAISAVCYNDWNVQSMRVGQSCCKITLWTTQGYVTLTKDTKNKINSYSGKKYENDQQFLFQSIGVTVPQIVYQITGMPPLKIADTNIDIPNIMYQLDKHYMLAQVSGKSCTSNLVARIFDKVIGLGGMQELISQISSSMINDKKQITKKMSQSDQLQNQLIDQLVLTEKQLTINSAKKTKKQIIQLQNKLQKMDLFIDNYSNLNQKLSSIDSKYIDLDIQMLQEILQKIFSLQKNLQLIYDLHDKNEKLKHDLLVCNETINKYTDLNLQNVQQIKQICNKIYIIQRILNKYSNSLTELQKSNQIINQFDQLDNSSKLLQQIKQICNKLYLIDKVSSKYQTKMAQKKNQIEQIQIQNKLYLQFDERIQKFKKDNKICPLCGKPFCQEN